MATTEISSEFLTTIKISFSQMIDIAKQLNSKRYSIDISMQLTPEERIINDLINDAKSVLSQMEGFVWLHRMN